MTDDLFILRRLRTNVAALPDDPRREAAPCCVSCAARDATAQHRSSSRPILDEGWWTPEPGGIDA